MLGVERDGRLLRLRLPHLVDGGAERGRVRKSVGRILRQRLLEEVVQLARSPEKPCADGRRGRVHHVVRQRRHVVAGERAISAEHLIEDRGEGEKVAARVDRGAAELFGRHVRGRSEDVPRPGQL
jgi:hypothetical protein